jgi:hypothetical protein
MAALFPWIHLYGFAPACRLAVLQLSKGKPSGLPDFKPDFISFNLHRQPTDIFPTCHGFSMQNGSLIHVSLAWLCGFSL